MRYSPGDGHTYVWDGDLSQPIRVYRHNDHAVSGMTPTGDTIDPPAVASAQAMAIKVDEWRVSHVAYLA